MNACNGYVLCKPPAKVAQEKKAGLNLVNAVLELTVLEVLVGNGAADPSRYPLLRAGDYIAVRGSALAQPWAKERLTMPGFSDNLGRPIEFVIVPVGEVVVKC